jgi:hypothetical protein
MDNAFRIEPLFLPTPGARLTFSTEMSASIPHDPPHETYAPDIHPAVTYPSHTQLLPSLDVTAKELPPIYLLRETGAKEAYTLVGGKSIKLNHRGDGHGVKCTLQSYTVLQSRRSDLEHVPSSHS